MAICPECDGAGSLFLLGQSGSQRYRESYLCPFCDGSGATPIKTTVNTEYIVDSVKQGGRNFLARTRPIGLNRSK